MASVEHSAIREEDIQGLKYFRKLWPLFERLHEVGCQRDTAGNRQLFMDQYCSLVLLFMFIRASVRCERCNERPNFRTCSESWVVAEHRWGHFPKRPTCSIPSGCKRLSANWRSKCGRCGASAANIWINF